MAFGFSMIFAKDKQQCEVSVPLRLTEHIGRAEHRNVADDTSQRSYYGVPFEQRGLPNGPPYLDG